MAATNSARRAFRRWNAVLLIITVAAALAPAAVHAQQAPPDGSSGFHVLLGGFVGRLDLDGAGETDLFGGRAGVGLGELLQLTGFYWRGFDRSADSITADYAWGGELQLNLNSGFGLTPFLTAGIARVDEAAGAAQTAALVGGGVMFPLGPVLIQAGARDYMFGITGLSNDDSPDDVTHNWLYSAGVSVALGSRRARRPVTVAAPSNGADARAVAELTALRDSLRLADTTSGPARTRLSNIDARLARLDSAATPRNYHSRERIDIPIPTEGSITLRYGPEPAPAGAPVVVNVPGAASQAAVPGIAAAVPVPPAPAGASLDDPATRRWIEQVVAGQVAQQLAQRVDAGAAPALTQSQIDALAQRVLDGVVATVVPRLDAAQAERMSQLREDIRVALNERRTDLPQPAAQPIVSEPVVPSPASAPAASPAGPSPERRLREEAERRTELAALASAHPRFLTAAETSRGPAAVLGDAAFGSGAALVSDDARVALAAVAAVLRQHPDRRVYIQAHTDAAGSELQNMRLSELRAEAVRALLVREGVDPGRMYAIGYGRARPIGDNATAAGRALNRRVEIVIGDDLRGGGVE